MEIHQEDALAWALKTAAAGVPVSDVLADATLIQDWFGVKLSPVAKAIATVTALRDRLPDLQARSEYDPWAKDGLVDDLLSTLIIELTASSTGDDACADLVAERDRARETAVRLEQELAESERKRIEDGTKLAAYEMEADNLIKGVLMEVRRAGSQKPAPEWAAVCDVVARAAQKFGVEL